MTGPSLTVIALVAVIVYHPTAFSSHWGVSRRGNALASTYSAEEKARMLEEAQGLRTPAAHNALKRLVPRAAR